MKKRALSLLLVLSLLLGLSACGQKGGQTPTDSGETYLFTDDVGREVEIPTTITRIVPAAPLAQIVLLAIAPEMFVGLSSELYDSARGIIADEMFALPCFGSLYSGADLNVEELALAGPELIIDIGEPKGSSVEDLDTLQEQTLIPSVFISASLETMPDTFRRLGRLLGREEKARSWPSSVSGSTSAPSPSWSRWARIRWTACMFWVRRD